MNSDDVVFAIFIAAAVPVNLYPFFYAFRPWHTTAQGQALMVKAIGNVLVIDVALLTLVLGEDYPGRGIVRVIGFGMFLAGITYLFLSLVLTPGASKYPPWTWIRSIRRVLGRHQQ